MVAKCTRLSLSVVAIFAAAAPAGARAQALEEAQRHYLRAEFEEAADLFAEVLRQPSLTIAEAVSAHRYLIALRQMLGDETRALGHAEAALALDPSLLPPEGAPKAVEALLERVRLRYEGRPARLLLTADGPIEVGSPLRITVELRPAPHALAEALEIRCVSGTAVVDDRGPPPELTVSIVPADSSVTCSSAARTGGGAALLRARRELRAAKDGALGLSRGEPAEEDEEGGGGRLGLALGLAGTAAAVAAGIGLALYLSLGSKESDTANFAPPTVEGW